MLSESTAPLIIRRTFPGRKHDSVLRVLKARSRPRRPSIKRLENLRSDLGQKRPRAYGCALGERRGALTQSRHGHDRTAWMPRTGCR